MRASTAARARPWVQLAAFLVFLFVTVFAAFVPAVAGLFFWIDPLAGAARMLAAREVSAALLIGALASLLFALLLGRAWCGWLCPLGAVLDWTPARRARPNDRDLPRAWRRVKYVLLVMILVLALFGNLSLVFLDPITLATRSVAVVAWPAFNALLSGAEQAAYAVPFLRAPVDAVESARGVILPLTTPLYRAAVVSALVIFAILALNAVRPRFWCRYLCPLGALLGLVAKAALIRRDVSSDCVACNRCVRDCPVGTIDPDHGYRSNPAECTLCLECATTCPRDGQTFAPHRSLAAHHLEDPSRRHFLAAAGGAILTLGILAVEPASRLPSPHLVRPPGAFEPDFSARCIRCGLCIRACPTSGLQPSLAAAGWGGMWTPVLVPRLGHCDYGCNACGQVCPTGAIPPLPLGDRRGQVMGHAYIDRDRCLPWADSVTCLVCEEMCPLPDKAIQLEDVLVQSADGTEVPVRRPLVLRDRCTGCGICENRCPLTGEAAIRVYAPTELTAS